MIRISLFTLVVCSLALTACGSSDKAASTTSSAAASSRGYSRGGSSGDEVEMYDNYFSPKTITGKAGSTATVKLKNEGKVEHNFKIDSQKQADADIEPGKEASVKVTIPASGSIQFYCEYHKRLGMAGAVKAS